MASPVDAGRIATNITTAVDPLPITLPGSIVAGDLLVSFVRIAGGQTIVSNTGWTNFVNDNSDASDDRTFVFYRWADAASDALSIDMSATAKCGAITWRITGAENPATQAPQAGTIGLATTVANTCDPGTVTPTGGSKDYLFLALGGGDGEVGAFTASPTNYSTITAANSGTGGTPAQNVIIGAGSRQLTASSEDPGAFTHAAFTTGGTGIAIAIHPAAPAVPTTAAVTAPPMAP